ncbi:molybdenum cofactor cytidylyltransferase [Modicisalibacter ilicicola DSM 19980]|uniref:Molybdenum cofactor cytidylyltransferase n=1 Tax=Modicisalibacter ilicicola DSM 19980 TaxID=1121942 RepID=A0A1M5AZP1_9GAMM|nr:nucleotidyltransferase family protein [Halomonas ilicicola]SHF35626.1 molybdenum cofactor cytidylyltransferase [Halomonas ilicicola DSM 19980]
MPCEPTRDDRRVIALVMAAGRSRRFGTDKRRARMADGRSLLHATLALAKGSFADTWVVVGDRDDTTELGIDSDIHALHAPGDDIGLGTSLGIAFSELRVNAPRALAAAVMLGDMPWVSPDTCRRLIAQAQSERIVLPRHQGRTGHPILFGRVFWPTLARLHGDRGARDLLRQWGTCWKVVEVSDPGIHRDVDVPSDLDI